MSLPQFVVDLGWGPAADSAAMDSHPPTAPAVPERRRHQRKRFFGRARLVVLGGAARTAAATDLSAGGIGLVIDAQIDEGSRCVVSFDLPTHTRERVVLHAKARVMNCVYSSERNGFKLGLMFVDPERDVLESVEAFIRT
jgi:hypothetical protein